MADEARSLVERCRAIGSSTWSDALDMAGLPGVVAGLTPRVGRGRVAGPALTVLDEIGHIGSAAPEEFGIERILSSARPGEVVLIHQVGEGRASSIGGLAALAAHRSGLAGIVIDGACRDVDELEDVGLPVFSRSLTPESGRGRIRRSVGVPLAIGEWTVSPGDMLVADETGVVVLPGDRVMELIGLAEERAAADARDARKLRG